jgi:hypothetical protein
MNDSFGQYIGLRWIVQQNPEYMVLLMIVSLPTSYRTVFAICRGH